MKILIADNHPIFREGLKKIFLINDDFNIVAEAGDGREVVKLTMKLHPDIVILDINLSNMNGLEATKVILRELPDTKVVALTSSDNQEYVNEMAALGAYGYLLKEIKPDKLIKLVEEVFAGNSLFEKEYKVNLKTDKKTYLKKELAEDLTRRERDVLQLIARGMCNKDIAATLFVSEKTVKNHLTNIFKKIQVEDRTQAALFAIKKGIVKL